MAKATASARDRDVVYVVKVDVDGYRRTTLPKSAEDGEGYVSAKVALKAYDAAIVSNGAVAKAPKSKGEIQLVSISDGYKHETVKSSTWKPGFGWF